MRRIFLMIFSVNLILFSGCSQVQLETQKAELKKQEVEIQELEIELKSLKFELAESKQTNIDLEAQSKASIQLLAEAQEQNKSLTQELAEVRTRLNSAVRLLTTEPDPKFTANPIDASNANVAANPDKAAKTELSNSGLSPEVSEDSVKPSDSN